MFILELGDDHMISFPTTLYHLLVPENFMFNFLQPGHDVPLILRASNIFLHQNTVNLAHLLWCLFTSTMYGLGLSLRVLPFGAPEEDIVDLGLKRET